MKKLDFVLKEKPKLHFEITKRKISFVPQPTQEKTVTPTASGFSVLPDGDNLLSKVNVLGDANLVAENVRDMVNIFGVTGNMKEGITPTGTEIITANGTYDVTEKEYAEVNVPGIVPSGSVTLTQNGAYDVTEKETAVVSVPTPSGTINITANGDYDVTDKAIAHVDVQTAPQTQEKTVTPDANGFDVTPDAGKLLSKVHVNGDANLVAENVRDMVNIFGVTGNMKEGITPTGTEIITANGTYDVTEKEYAEVNVPGIVPTGSVTLTQNGTYDVTDKVTAIVNVTLPNIHHYVFTNTTEIIPSSGGQQIVLVDDDFLKNNQNNPKLCVVVRSRSPVSNPGDTTTRYFPACIIAFNQYFSGITTLAQISIEYRGQYSYSTYSYTWNLSNVGSNYIMRTLSTPAVGYTLRFQDNKLYLFYKGTYQRIQADTFDIYAFIAE